MIGGLTVAVCVAAVLALAEMLVPRLLCAYVLWRQERDRAIRNASAGVEPVERDEVSGSRFQVSGDGFQVSGDGFQVEGDEVSGDGFQVGGVEAEKIWAEACGMVHSEIPDFSTDWQYMTLVHKAAELGHAGAMSALGDFAFQRGDVVEAFYWKQRVEMGGGRCRNPTLTDIVRVWTEVGCPDGGEEVGVRFPVQRADFAHAVLCLKSGVDPRFGTMRLKELSDAGDEDAMRFLKRR